MERNFRPNRSFVAPVKVGDEFDVKIEAVGEKGDGIAKKDGFVIFVPNTKEGEDVRVKVTRVLRRVGFGEVVGESSGAPESEEAESEESQEEPSEEMPEDSEDFGEEEEKE
jgi:predicted RNA-binding protein with TRAM domain